MKKIISIAVCFVILLSCVLPVQASGGVPEKVMDATKSVVRILSKYYNGSATGSGFVIKNEPGEVLIATNDHVVSGNPYSISVWVGENELVDAEIVFTTSAKDLCVLRVTDPIDMKPLALSTADPQHGAAIYVVGYPGAGDILSDTQAHTSDSVTITDGIISAIRTFTIENGAAPVKLLQVNAAINSGNSGGPLFNSEGVVIGVNTYKVNANSQGVFGSVDISELWGLLAQHGIEIPMQEEVAEEEIPEEKGIPVSVIAIAVGTVVALIVVFLLIKAKKKKAKTLRKYMEAHPNGLGVSEAVSMLLPVAIQLRDLHNNGKLHLQVSPDSILISAVGATLKQSSKKETDRHTAGFAAPEIYKGVGLGMSSDLYSFAAVLYYAATGKIPANSLQYELQETELAILEEAEPVFVETLRKGMAHLPQNRTQSMQELIYGVSAFSSQKLHMPESKVPVVPKQKKEKIKKQKKTVNAIPIVAATVLCSVVILLWKPYIQPQMDARNEAARLEEAYIAAVALLEEGRYEEAMEAFAALTGYKDSDKQQENCRIAMESAILEEQYQEATQLAVEGKYAHAGLAFNKLGDYKDSRERSFENWGNARRRITLSAWHYTPKHFIGLRKDGTVLSAGNNTVGQLEVKNWTDIVEVQALPDMTLGVKADGTVCIAGDPLSKTKQNALIEIRQWTDIVAIRANYTYIVGLKKDGTVVISMYVDGTHKNYINVDAVTEWTDIVEVYFGNYDNEIIGLRSDGSLVTNHAPQEIEEWENVVSIEYYKSGDSRLGKHIMGKCADGSVYVLWDDAGNHQWTPDYHGKIEGWTDIIDICGPVGLHADGSVSVYPENTAYRDNIDNLWKNDVNDWKDIAALFGDSTSPYGLSSVYGLKSDGTVVAAGNSYNGGKNVLNWEDIVYIESDGFITCGIKEDGTILIAQYVDLEMEKWTGIRIP